MSDVFDKTIGKAFCTTTVLPGAPTLSCDRLGVYGSDV